MNDGIDAFSVPTSEGARPVISPKDPLLAQWLSQRVLLEEHAADHQRLLSEFEAAIGGSQTAWPEQAKALAQQSLNAALLAARNSTASLLEEAARVNGAAVRKGARTGCRPNGESLAASRRIAWLNLAAAGRRLHGGGLRYLPARDSLTTIHPARPFAFLESAP